MPRFSLSRMKRRVLKSDSGTSSKDFRVRLVSIDVDNRDRNQGSSETSSDTPRTSLRKTSAFKPSNGANNQSKPPPVCFVGSKPDSKPVA